MYNFLGGMCNVTIVKYVISYVRVYILCTHKFGVGVATHVASDQTMLHEINYCTRSNSAPQCLLGVVNGITIPTSICIYYWTIDSAAWDSCEKTATSGVL